jgi:hypothetical protein
LVRVRRQHPEDDLQRSVVQFLRLALPPDAVHFSIPNGGKRHPREAARMVGLGLVSGIPDICVIHRGRVAFIELKAKAGVMSAAQKEMTRRLVYCGAAVCLCRSVEDVEAQLREACVPLRASVA